MSKPSKLVHDSDETVLSDTPTPLAKYSLRPGHKLDQAVATELERDKVKPGEHVYVGSKLHTFHSKNGETRQMASVTGVSGPKSASILGGWYRTSNADDIAALDELCAKFSGDFRKVYPVMA